METGINVQVPLFVVEGDLIRINTETGEYVERANG
jgi:elongation factor P